MKANAPEKLYILFNHPYTVDYTKLNKSRCEKEVERLLLRRQVGGLKKISKKWYENIKVHGFRGMTPLMIIEFKKYMKGE